ncbi:unnamed protein product [Arctogadus glacialis]
MPKGAPSSPPPPPSGSTPPAAAAAAASPADLPEDLPINGSHTPLLEESGREDPQGTAGLHRAQPSPQPISSPPRLLSQCAVTVGSREQQQQSFKLISWPEQTKPRPHSSS